MEHLWDALAHAYAVLGPDVATRHDEVLAQPVFVRIAEPTNKLDSLRVLETEHGAVRSGVDFMEGQAPRTIR